MKMKKKYRDIRQRSNEVLGRDSKKRKLQIVAEQAMSGRSTTLIFKCQNF